MGILTVFLTVFLAEIGDKTQLAAMLFSAEGKQDRWVVFTAATLALAVSTGVAILLGAAAERWLGMLPLQLIAGIGFLLIGAWMVYRHFS